MDSQQSEGARAREKTREGHRYLWGRVAMWAGPV